MIFNIIGIILIVIADQLTKYFAAVNFNMSTHIPIINNFIYLTYRPNTGAALSILEGRQSFLIIISTVAVLFGLFVLIKFYKKSNLFRTGLVFVIGGAIGNLIDRFRMGYVVDMIGFMRFFIFNVADSFITIGAVLIVIFVFKYLKRESK